MRNSKCEDSVNEANLEAHLLHDPTAIRAFNEMEEELVNHEVLGKQYRDEQAFIRRSHRKRK